MLPEDLANVAKALEARLQAACVETRTIPVGEWNCVPPKARSLIPEWYVELLVTFKLADALLERPHEYATYPRYFGFWLPEMFSWRIQPDKAPEDGEFDWWCIGELVQEGFIPVSDESDGNMWLISITGGPGAPVYLWDLSGWEKMPTSDSMAQFLATCSVSK